MTATVADDVTADTRRPKRRRRRWLMAGGVVVVVAAALAVTRYQRSVRAADVARELQIKGGQVYFPPSLIEGVQDWWETGDWTWHSETMVHLGASLDEHWLRDHHALQDLDVTGLEIYGSYPRTDAIKLLIDAHSIRSIGVSYRQVADPIAEFLSNESDLEIATFSDSGLTDPGLRALPLEQLRVLELDGTHVTTEGLEQLRRCRRLTALSLSGDQFTEPVADILESIEDLEWLDLHSSGVTDRVVPLLKKLPHLDYLYLYDSSISDEGLQDLDAALPGTVIGQGPPV